MKKITSRKESRRSSVSKPSAPKPGQLQYFTYDDVAASNAPEVGEFPQHGDTVALGDNEEEAEVARSRASRRISQAMEGREHEDIFANAPEEPLAPEQPRGGSRRDSRRSSRRASRRASFEGAGGAGLAPSSSRQSRAISPERDLTNGASASHSRRDSATGRHRVSRRDSETEATTQSPVPPAAPHEIPTAAGHTSVPVQKTKSRSSAVIPGPENAPTTVPTPPNAAGSLSQVPTAEDGISRAQTRASSGQPSRQSTRAGELDKRTSVMTAGSTRSKSKRQSKRTSKPEPLRYFTYDDVAEAQPPIFGKVPDPADLQTNEARSRLDKGKEREENGDTMADTEHLEDVPQVPELPQKLAHMDLSGTGLTRSSTRDAASGRYSAKRHEVQRTTAPVATKQASVHDQNLVASHGLDFSDIPGTRRAPAPPPPINMSTKPLSKQTSRDLKNDTSTAAAGAAGLATRSATQIAKKGADVNNTHDMPQQKRTSSFHEHLPEALRHGGTMEKSEAELGGQKQNTAQGILEDSADVKQKEMFAQQPSVVERTRQALGAVFLPNQARENPAPAPSGNQETGFVSAPSSPAADKDPFVPPNAASVIQNGQTGHANESGLVREERLTREVHTFDPKNPKKSHLNVEVLSKRYFMQTSDGRFVECTERDVPHDILSASRKRTGNIRTNTSQEHLSSQNI